ncbi:MAG: hypothetical protein RIT27_779 [Pseudomonadota bacterium]|jgi:type I restriction-modification system DNA methylase subunit
MALFQQRILSKYLEELPLEKVAIAYQKLVTYFHNKTIQQNIREAKEEQFQEGFLRELFVNILDYTINPHQNYNLTTEFKNLKDAKKADGAILDGKKVKAVIELKDTRKTDLKKIEMQAFGYKNNQPDCRYVIISNFEKLRLYIDNAVDFIEWDLFNLLEKDFKVLFLLLQKDQLFADLPAKIKNDSLIQEEDISKRFYQEYSMFRKELFQNLMSCNPDIEKLLLFKKTQKLLDRFLFLFFAKDKGLIPPNAVLFVLNTWKALKENPFAPQQSLYAHFKQYFHYLNSGFKSEKLEIFAYNGGLFAPDEMIEQLQISDAVLSQACEMLSKYNYDSEVDVNILGHIFEHSLKEIEELEIQLLEIESPQITRRKKDGIFYTPSYITQYIVENTLGVLCQQEKHRRDLKEEDFFFRKNTKANKATIKALLEKLQDYKAWLLNLSIVDPACGSGAFLNQALTFLIAEHKWLNELEAKLMNSSLVFDLENSILENNLFGVDINEESVEIAKLSLWLRTAKPRRQLISLNDNIKCGNSLIDDPTVAGEKAFHWQQMFPRIFEKGGFDVVIGNPPYVRLQGLKATYEKETHYFQTNYQAATKNYDIYVLFIERGFSFLKETGKIGFILPHKFLISEFGEGIRRFLVQHRAVESLLHFGSEMVFEDASTYTCILTLSKANQLLHFQHLKPQHITNSLNTFESISYEKLSHEKWHLNSSNTTKILEKLYLQPLTVKDVFAKIFQGIATSADDIYLIKGTVQGNLVSGYSKSLDKIIEIEKDFVKPLLKGEDISRYAYLKNRYFVIFPYLIDNNKATPMTAHYIQLHFPKGYDYLKLNEIALRNREKGRMNKEGWFLYIYPKSLTEFEQEKIITPEISLGSNMTYDNNNFYHGTTLYSFIKRKSVKESYKFYLAILNSRIMWFFLKNTGTELRGGYFRFKTKYLEPFPLPNLKEIKEQQPFVERVDNLLQLNQQLLDLKTDFNDYIIHALKVSKLSKKLQNPEKLSLEELIAELIKQKVAVDDFNIFKSIKTLHLKLLDIKNDIETTDQILNQMVYDLYQLTPDEIDLINYENESLLQ